MILTSLGNQKVLGVLLVMIVLVMKKVKPVVKKVKIQAQLNFTKIDKSSAFKQMNADLKKLTDKAKSFEK